MSQEKQRKAQEPTPEDHAEVAAPKPERSFSDELDNLLGDMDAVLEEDAETFVREFVQRGGQ